MDTQHSPKGKHPEKQKQRLLSLSLPKASQILSPELPFALQRRTSVRSQLTAITHDTQSTTSCSDVLSHVAARRLTETDDEEEYSEAGASRSEKATSTFFIPGITGKARCLQSNPFVEKCRPVDVGIEEKASTAESSRASTKRSEKSSRSRNSRTSTGPSRSSSHETSDDRSDDDSLDPADLLYGAVVESIQARRKEGLTDLGEGDFQRMLSLLQHDAAEPSLREQVTSIRMIISDFERKKLLKQKKSKKR